MTSVLPIKNIKSSFIQAIKNNQTVILSAPPGAGKSTCLPLWLLNESKFSGQKIYLLQPRRIAVKNIALYLASQLGESVGQTIGYRLRDETKVSQQTQLEVITEGILTQIIQNDAELADCGLVIFDEFHERSLQGDLAFALARDIQQGLRDDLKILLMSATLNSEQLASKLPDAVTLKSQGRSYPVEIIYHAPTNVRRWREHTLQVIDEQMHIHQGSILVFLPGVSDIRYLAEHLTKRLPNHVDLYSLYGNLSLKEQQKVMTTSVKERNKIVLSTNIAETSLTIDGINCVIDCGFEKRSLYDHVSLTNKLIQQQISKASAIQRAGRAGRLMAGKCIRLYAKDNFERRQEQAISEIHQADLLPSLIEAARWGVSKLACLPMLELPSKIKEQQAWQELISLTIVDNQHKLTQHGEKVAKLSCHPRFAQMILRASSLDTLFNGHNYASLACILAAMLAERDIFNNAPAQPANCDLRQRMQVFINKTHAYPRILQQAQRLSKQLHISLNTRANLLPINELGVLLALAYPERIAKIRHSDALDYLCANGKGVSLMADDILSAQEFIVAADLMQSHNNVLTIRLAAPVALWQLELLFARQINNAYSLTYNQANGKIIARQQKKLFALVLATKPSETTLTPAKVSTMWCDLVREKGLAFLNWRQADLTLKTRWQWLTKFVADADLPVMSKQYLLDNLAIWFAPYVGEIKNKTQLDKLRLSDMLLSLLDYAQQQTLQKLVPEFYLGPTGRRCPITYNTEQQSPKVSLPMQEVYGLALTPQVGDVQIGKGIPLVLELLSPAGRPIQITQDLKQFWQGSYFAVQKEMKAKYPKHYWPDDPANAKPTNKTKRHIV